MRLAAYVLAFLAFFFVSTVYSYDDYGAYNEANAKTSIMYSAAAYCDAAKLSNWSCPACTKYNIPALSSVTVLQDSGKNFQGYIGKTSSEIVVSFRGSRNLANWIANLQSLNQVQYNYDGCSGCMIAEGFYKAAYLPLATQLKNAISKFGKSLPVRVTGHSLGGAMASIAAFELRVDGYNVATVHTVGAPRVGNPAFVNKHKAVVKGESSDSSLRLSTEQVVRNAYLEVMQHLGDSIATMTSEERSELSPFLASAFESYTLALSNKLALDNLALENLIYSNGANVIRIVNGADPVPHLPPRDWTYKFQHVPSEVWYKDQVTPTTCNDAIDEDSKCSNSILVPLAVNHHMTYAGIRLNQYC